ncbi:GAP family protein [Nocardia sp. NBC_00508]|uniref:GAP family protein n=1 Tax=Nocardia sp. NBC_00508 TaxID=2975992 RepID=UPI002E81E3F1|nr:GAP family protein [Nocardia sp. NBC_00508]WUD67944.1 GAP family protein [Nocardia sp. NBC_00508]
MTATIAAALTGLGLIDSTSFGTLLIPIWLLLSPGRLQASRIVVYLATVAVCYFGVGVVLVLGADAALAAMRTGTASLPPVPLRIGQLILGLLVIAWSYRLEARAARQAGTPGKIQRWREKAMSGSGSSRGLVQLALLAVALEVATMLPYLAAVGLIVHADLGWQLTGSTLAAYCVVMILPALALAAARLAAHQRVDPILRRVNDWLTRNSAKTLGWTVGGIGIGISLNAVAVLILERP